MSLVRTPTPIVLSLVVLSGATSAVPAHGQLAVSVGDESIRVFQECVSAYILMRQQIAEQLLADWVEADADTRFRRRLAAAIQATRRDSRPGDILCAGIGEGILRTVRMDLARRAPLDRQAILMEVRKAHVRLNDVYPDGAPFATMPPLLLLQLPPLPAGLEYRFLGNAVILLDVDATLVVDFVPNALSPTS